MLREVEKSTKQPVRSIQWRRPLDAKALKVGRVQPDLSRQVRVSGGFSWKWSNAKVNNNG